MTAKPEALQLRAEAEAECRSQMPAMRGPIKECAHVCLAAARGP